jgi:hypothetical protein
LLVVLSITEARDYDICVLTASILFVSASMFSKTQTYSYI